MAFFTELEQKKKSQFIWKHKRPQISKAVLRKTVLQSYSHQDSMILAQKQKYRPMEQDREPRDKPMHLRLIFDKGGKNIQ